MLSSWRNLGWNLILYIWNTYRKNKINKKTHLSFIILYQRLQSKVIAYNKLLDILFFYSELEMFTVNPRD